MNVLGPFYLFLSFTLLAGALSGALVYFLPHKLWAFLLALIAPALVLFPFYLFGMEDPALALLNFSLFLCFGFVGSLFGIFTVVVVFPRERP